MMEFDGFEIEGNIKVKVYSNFLKEIVDDLGFTIVFEDLQII